MKSKFKSKFKRIGALITAGALLSITIMFYSSAPAMAETVTREHWDEDVNTNKVYWGHDQKDYGVFPDYYIEFNLKSNQKVVSVEKKREFSGSNPYISYVLNVELEAELIRKCL